MGLGQAGEREYSICSCTPLNVHHIRDGPERSPNKLHQHSSCLWQRFKYLSHPCGFPGCVLQRLDEKGSNPNHTFLNSQILKFIRCVVETDIAIRISIAQLPACCCRRGMKKIRREVRYVPVQICLTMNPMSIAASIGDFGFHQSSLTFRIIVIIEKIKWKTEISSFT